MSCSILADAGSSRGPVVAPTFLASRDGGDLATTARQAEVPDEDAGYRAGYDVGDSDRAYDALPGAEHHDERQVPRPADPVARDRLREPV